MQKQKTILIIAIIIVVLAVILGGIFAYQYFSAKSQTVVQTDQTADWKNYKNAEYGFGITFPDSWKGYSIVKSQWRGWNNETQNYDYQGVQLVFKNPQSTTAQSWQDVLIMVVTPDVWGLIKEGGVSVSAAPVGPAKIGQNGRYVFATPPRWYGFTDASGIEEALNIVKTFKAF